MSLERQLQVLIGPHISEKSTIATDEAGRYVFRVTSAATKRDVKAAVEYLFDVKVAAVNLLNVAGKLKKFKMQPGRRKSWKKAYVSLADGHTIDFEAIEQ